MSAPDFDLFINRVKSLFNIDGDLLPELTREEQGQFVRHPVSYFIKANDAQAEAIFREVEKRQRKPVSTNADLVEALTALVSMYEGVCSNLPYGMTSKAEIAKDLEPARAALAKVLS